MQSYAYNAPDTQHALTQQTLMQPLYVTLFIMLRGYLDEFQIAGAKNATQQIRSRLGAPTQKVSSSDGTAIYEGQERECFILYRRSNNNKAQTHLPLKHRNITKTNQNLYQKWYTGHLMYPKMVKIVPVSLTFHGHLASLRSSRRPKTVNFGYG